MTAQKPNAVIRCAIRGRVQGTVQGNVGQGLLRLSYLSLLPTPATTLRPGTLPRASRLSALTSARPTARGCERLAGRDRSWRHDGLTLSARYRTINDVQVNDAMPSQESPKSKAFASA
jgi:hypothetical protein